MLHVHRAERSDLLVTALADVLTEPLPDPLQSEMIAVPSRGIERWIAQELSLRLGTGPLGDDGVCVNVEFPFPASLIRSAVAAGSGIDPDLDPWSPERLTWPLLELVETNLGAAMLGPLRAHLGGDHATPDPEDVSRRFGAVRHVADLFDRYGVHRPGMVRRWRDGDPSGPNGGPLGERHRWQAVLWSAVRDAVGVESFAERHDAAVRVLADYPDVLDLPPRIALFGLTALPASYLTVLAAIARHRDVHLLLLYPSRELWDRVAAEVDDAGQQLWAREADPTRQVPRNPLLASWGRDARELQLVAPVPDDPDGRHHHPMDETEPATLLERIQVDVCADRYPAGGDDRPLLEPDDRSVQLHDCHGKFRQVEVVRDAILHLLAEDEDLEPRDIIVMCPDIETFAPLVTAVFGADAVVDDTDDADGETARTGGPPALRVTLADRALRRTNPLLEVVAELLDAADGRVTASGVLDLIAREPVRRRFRFDDDDVSRLESWIAELQIRWGLDPEHRRRHGLPEVDAHTWRAGLRRLLLGMAMADEDLRLIDGVVPYDGVEGASNDLAGRLVELVARLGNATDAMRGPRPVDGWRDTIATAADTLTLTDHQTGWQRLQLHRILRELAEEATVDGEVSTVELDLAEIRTLLEQRLRGRPSTTGHRTGDLTVCTLVPMRSVPHRVVCLLGLDDGAFPRQAVPDSDDLLQWAPRVGDRDPRSEDRQLLLDAVLAATETLVITYAGRDHRTNEARPPAVPVDELRDVIDRTVRTDEGTRARDRITITHPLQAYDTRNFDPGRLRSDGPWGFHPPQLAAAQAARGQLVDPPPFLTSELDLPEEDVIELDDLVAFLEHPARAFVRQRLELTLPSEDEQPSDSVPVTLEALDAWKVGDHLIGAWLRGEDLDRAERVARARDLIPPGELATSELADIRARVERIMQLCDRLDITPGRRRTVDVKVELADGRTLAGSVPHVNGWRVETIGYSRVKAKHRLASWARLVALTAGEPAGWWNAATVGRHPWKKDHTAQATLVERLGRTPADAERAARAHLERLVDLFDRGRRTPIPVYCETSRKSAEMLRSDDDPTKYVKSEWETDSYAGYEREDRDPYHLLVLGRQVPTDELFEAICRDDEERSWADDDRRIVAYAWRLWQPILDAERTVTRS